VKLLNFFGEACNKSMISEKHLKSVPTLIRKIDMGLADEDLGVEKPLPNNHFFMMISGRPSSGKSALICSLLCFPKTKNHSGGFHNVFDQVHIFSPSAHTLGVTLDLPEERLHPDLASLDEVMVQRDIEKRYLFIFDDCAAFLNGSIEKLFHRLIWNRRHARTSIIITCQVYNSIPLKLRKSLSHICLFKSTSKKELQCLHEEVFPHLDAKVFRKLCEYIWNEPYSFMYHIVDRCVTHKRFVPLVIKDSHEKKEKKDENKQDSDSE
jgi:hypothetical protein